MQWLIILLRPLDFGIHDVKSLLGQKIQYNPYKTVDVPREIHDPKKVHASLTKVWGALALVLLRAHHLHLYGFVGNSSRFNRFFGNISVYRGAH